MILDSINLNNLRVFQCVYRMRSMTAAAKELHLTQSGVSQHLKSLEESLGVMLFDRINKKLFPTDAGDMLFGRIQNVFKDLEYTLSEITDHESHLMGTVRIGVPNEFGVNLVIPKLAKLGKEYPEIKTQISFGFASQINEMLVAGQLDFGFVDNFKMDRKIATEKVFEEVFCLCAHKDYLKSKGRIKANSEGKAYYEELDYIAYSEGEPVLRSWFTHHLKRKNLNLNVRAHVFDVQGTAAFIVNKLGVGILPDYLAKGLIDDGENIHIFKGSGKALKNPISVAYLKDRSFPPQVQLFLDAVKEL